MNAYLVLITAGFLLIAVGTVGWFNSVTVEKQYKVTETRFVDGKGATLDIVYGDLFFDRYEIVSKEKK